VKIKCFYAVIEQPGNVAACHINEVKEFGNLAEFEAWIDETEGLLFPDGTTQIVVAATDATNETALRYAYIGEPKGDARDICTVFNTHSPMHIQCQNMGVEFPDAELVADINEAWEQPHLELRVREGLASASLCRDHLNMVGEI
jgi:hypothetical protein